jgi:dTDP-4-dehydrorhamnose reductase
MDLVPLEIIEAVRADAIVNAAAYTAVDSAEEEPAIAHAVNVEGARRIAAAAARLRVPLLQISTDYVFDGDARRPYREGDPSSPINVYGHSKLLGEDATLAAAPATVVVRTSWIYSPFSRNFVRTMLRLATRQNEVRVVTDQRGVPNYAPDLADAIIDIVHNCLSDSADERSYGLFHLSSGEATTWADFATEIFATSANLGGPSARVVPISSSDYPSKARRPPYSVLDSSLVQKVHGVRLPPRRKALEACVARLLASAANEHAA